MTTTITRPGSSALTATSCSRCGHELHGQTWYALSFAQAQDYSRPMCWSCCWDVTTRVGDRPAMRYDPPNRPQPAGATAGYAVYLDHGQPTDVNTDGRRSAVGVERLGASYRQQLDFHDEVDE